MTIQQMHPVAHWPLVLGVLRRLEVATLIDYEILCRVLGRDQAVTVKLLRNF
jgi:hypothetical protein